MIRRLLLRAPRGLVLGLVPGLLLIGASGAHPAYATDVDDIVNSANGKCLSQENSGVVIDQCDATQRQDWKIVTAAGNFLIRNDLTGQCLTITDPAPGGQVVPTGCDFSGNTSSQLWFFSQGFIINVRANLAMQPSGCGAANDLPVFINTGACNAAKWVEPDS